MKIDKLPTDQRLILLSLFEKWNPIALGCHIDGGTSDCLLCYKYRRDKCMSCPIREKVGKPYCQNTPYIAFIQPAVYESIERYKNIEKEIEFLISLLDKKVQKNLETFFIEWSKNNNAGTVNAWQVYSPDTQECIIFKNNDLANSQTILFDEFEDVVITPVTVFLTSEELFRFENGEAIWA